MAGPPSPDAGEQARGRAYLPQLHPIIVGMVFVLIGGIAATSSEDFRVVMQFHMTKLRELSTGIWPGSLAGQNGTGKEESLSAGQKGIDQQQQSSNGWKSSDQGQKDDYVSICVAAKDEHCDIREWVLYHASIGVSKIYIFDTQSAAPMRPVLEDLISSGLVEYRYVTNKSEDLQLREPPPTLTYNWQLPIYQLCLREHGARHRWMAFIDVDEFVVLQDGLASLPQLLRQYEQYGGVELRWRYFASGGHTVRPAAGVLRSYTQCCMRWDPDPYPGKSIVQPRYTVQPFTVHIFQYVSGKYGVNTAGTRMVWHEVQPADEGAVLHHYFAKSRAEFALKIERRGGTGRTRTFAEFDQCNELCTSNCTQAVGLGGELARRYNLTRNVPLRCFSPQR